MEQNPFMAEAIRLSIESVTEHNGGPFGCVIVKDGKIIARGFNQVTQNNDPTAHAEIVAIREACKALDSFQLSDCDIYTSCEPCPMCLGAIYWARPRKVYFANTRQDAATIGFDDDFIYRELKENISKRELPFEQLMKEEAQKAFRLWADKKDKKGY
jgi:tRNA(Arg) A34 adenosine deaminase TadA